MKTTEEFMHRVATQDEAWGHHFASEAKKQSMQWKDPGSPKKFTSFFSREGDSLYLLGKSEHYHGGLPYGKLHNKWCILCRRTKAAASGDCEEKKLASVAQLDARSTGDQEVAGLTPAGSATFCRGDLIRKYFLWSFSRFH